MTTLSSLPLVFNSTFSPICLHPEAAAVRRRFVFSAIADTTRTTFENISTRLGDVWKYFHSTSFRDRCNDNDVCNAMPINPLDSYIWPSYIAVTIFYYLFKFSFSQLAPEMLYPYNCLSICHSILSVISTACKPIACFLILCTEIHHSSSEQFCGKFNMFLKIWSFKKM